jgi:ectoine hydroxylase-related dioxygenase (phytanoyl-CoA dioxygenase family)
MSAREQPGADAGSDAAALAAAIERAGFAIVARVIPAEELAELARALDDAPPVSAAHTRGGQVYAMRDLLERVPRARTLADSPEIRAVVEPVLGPSAFVVRGLLFDKTPEANWVVPWHQDLTIAVRARREVPGFGPWTRKNGIPHVNAPVSVLERMLSVRIHLDDCGAANGPLRVVPGSHRFGRLDTRAERERLAYQAPVDCLVERGGVVAMRPLILHASSSALRPSRRRVIHLEFAADRLPAGVEWLEAPQERAG